MCDTHQKMSINMANLVRAQNSTNVCKLNFRSQRRDLNRIVFNVVQGILTW